MSRLLPVFLSPFALASGAANAAPHAFTLDKGHAYLGFEIYHAGYSHTVGQFRDFDGTFLIDEEKPENSEITFTVKMASLDSNHEARDAHVKSADFLDAKKFPTMTFKSTKVVMTTPTEGRVTGDLTLHGVTKPLTLAFHMVQDKKYPSFIPNYDEVRTVGFEATGSLLRLDYGVDGVAFLGSPVGLEVAIKANFDLLDCAGKPATNIPCHYGR